MSALLLVDACGCTRASHPTRGVRLSRTLRESYTPIGEESRGSLWRHWGACAVGLLLVACPAAFAIVTLGLRSGSTSVSPVGDGHKFVNAESVGTSLASGRVNMQLGPSTTVVPTTLDSFGDAFREKMEQGMPVAGKHKPAYGGTEADGDAYKALDQLAKVDPYAPGGILSRIADADLDPCKGNLNSPTPCPSKAERRSFSGGIATSSETPPATTLGLGNPWPSTSTPLPLFPQPRTIAHNGPTPTPRLRKQRWPAPTPDTSAHAPVEVMVNGPFGGPPVLGAKHTPTIVLSSSSLTVTTTSSSTVTSTAAASVQRYKANLFCFAVMMPTGYELALLQELLRKGLSLFACDEYSVFSDREIVLSSEDVGPLVPVSTENVGNVTCPYGGMWYLALNTEVFVRIWNKVIRDAKYEKADWTVKVDPDAVFLPQRLRGEVAHSDPERSVYLNNCDQGLHGPIEVISHGGMKVFTEGISKCQKKLKHEWDEWGEDVFLRHCLRLLHVDRVDNFNILSEDRCLDRDPTKTGCTAGNVAFHPFKNMTTWMKCYEETRHHG